MTFGIPEFDRGHSASGLGKRDRALAADRRGAGVACATPCGFGIVRDEREVLEHKIAGSRIARIGTTGMVEAFQIHTASAERHC